MFLRGCAALLALASTSVASPGITPLANYPLVHQVRCKEGSGTAFRVAPHTFLSVAHVARLTDCAIDGEPVMAALDGPKDFAILELPSAKEGRFKINCDGYVPGEYYFAVGYAGGKPWQTTVTVLATYAKTRSGMQIMLGSPTFIPGMSGGPVMNRRGEVVGLVNAYSPIYPISLSRALKDTAACSKE